MQKLDVSIENCYGINKFKSTIDFSNNNSCAIYAANGSFKTSLAKTFDDIAKNQKSRDEIFPHRKSRRTIQDENQNQLTANDVMVVHSYDAEFQSNDKTSMLLVNDRLRKEHEAIFKNIEKNKSDFFTAMRKHSKLKTGVEFEIAKTFRGSVENFGQLMTDLLPDVLNHNSDNILDLPYDLVFDSRTVEFLNSSDILESLQNYIERYNKLLEESKYLKKGTFDQYNAEQVNQALAKNGYFDANHSVTFKSETNKEINSTKELQELIDAEKKQIATDPTLRSKFETIQNKLHRNEFLRKFQEYLQANPDMIPWMTKLDELKREYWKSCFKNNLNLYENLEREYRMAEKRIAEIEDLASKEKTQWEEVVEIFNSRFIVPFRLIMKNRNALILGRDSAATIDFVFDDGNTNAPIDRNSLLKTLSTGEQKALYMLNIIFEIEIRRKNNQPCLFIFDDIADSFDYKNKYAILEYLREIHQTSVFKMLILTHNFDFFRTLASRLGIRGNCKMITKSPHSIQLIPAVGLKNLFLQWKTEFYTCDKKKIGSIAFIRNIIEYTKSTSDSDYLKLTSLLHWKKDSASITINDLDKIFNKTFNLTGHSANLTTKAIQLIFDTADSILASTPATNIEDRVVLAIAIRLRAEKYMITQINDPTATDAINSNQTTKLIDMFSSTPRNSTELNLLKKVVLMTPETIHMNSFMYEPIIDMTDDHLRRLYNEIKIQF